MKFESKTKGSPILSVHRTKREAKQFYDRISVFYDYLTGTFERKYAKKTLDHLCIVKGETILEIGFGTGHCLKRILEDVNQKGNAYGVDISLGMIEVTKRSIKKAGLIDRVDLCCGDAMSLPYNDSVFDAVFMSFTLELFDSPEIPKVLYEIKRILKPGGRLGIVSMSKENGESILLKLYELVHSKWPKYFDCRPIYVEKSLKNAGYKMKIREKIRFFGLNMEVVVALNGC